MVIIRILLRRAEAAVGGAVAGSLLLLVLSSFLTFGMGSQRAIGDIHWSDLLILVAVFLVVTLVAMRLQAALVRVNSDTSHSPVAVALYAGAMPLSSALWLGIFEGLEGLTGMPAVGAAAALSVSCAVGAVTAQMMDPGRGSER